MNRRTLLATAAGTVAAASLPKAAFAATGTAEAKDVMNSTAPYRSPARAQLAALRHGRITARGLLDQVLAHHGKINPGLNAVVTLDAASARASADEADEYLATTGRTLGPLHGLPITVKDALETRGLRTTCGSPDLSGHVPSTDADAVALLRQAGAIIIGKTNTPAMCQDIQTSNTLFGKTNNPHSPKHTAGGSSGGPAVAVATGLSALEIGSDLAGSLRLPAAYCGVYALRTSRGASPIVPTRGHIPRPPGWLTSSDMLTLGPIARTADDLDLLLDVLAAPSPADGAAWSIDLPAPTKTTLGRFRVGLWADDPFCRVDAATRTLMDQVAKAVRAAGASLDDSARPVDFAESNGLFERLMYATSAATSSDEAFAGEVKAADAVADDAPSALYLKSRTMRHRDWARADEDRHALRAKWAGYFTTHDVLITPAAPTAAVLDQTSVPSQDRYITVDGEKRSFFDQTSWVNLSSPVGLPSVVMPTGQTSDGLPLAIQIIGPYLSDRTVIGVAKLLAKVLPAAPVAPALTA
ncbi:amidase family protein [Streptomyces sp. NBC_01433]|uniref:amidase family protein n=1 Tax=Streptomyces sp. NBC_01433 TaxID=2903864 RepID=UPI0022519660|nr:amidase family protein [Streptomyces sp. NBC_01433]MCX4677688.1 amidase family protein [Streptomyces sp. NBC_01433]